MSYSTDQKIDKTKDLLKDFFIFSFKCVFSKYIFIVLLFVSLVSSYGIFSKYLGGSFYYNKERITIEKDFNCQSINCLNSIPFKGVGFGGFNIGSIEPKYKGHDKDYYSLILLEPIKSHTFVRKFEIYFSDDDLRFILFILSFMSIIYIRKSK